MIDKCDVCSGEITDKDILESKIICSKCWHELGRAKEATRRIIMLTRHLENWKDLAIRRGEFNNKFGKLVKEKLGDAAYFKLVKLYYQRYGKK